MITFEELQKYNQFATIEELKFLLLQAFPLSSMQKLSDLKEYCVSNLFSFAPRFDSTIKLLEYLSLIEIKNNYVKILTRNSGEFEQISGKELFGEGILIRNMLDRLKRDIAIFDFIKPEAIAYSPIKKQYYIKDQLIPHKHLNTRNIFISLDLFCWDNEFEQNILYVNNRYSHIFQKYLVDDLKRDIQEKKTKLTLDELKNRLEVQEIEGKKAEIFVLEYERKRLNEHPNINAVQMVSDEYVNAGYDIESFDNQQSVFIDRYIEVKSYVNVVSFHWTANEIEVSRKLADQYHLYIVDREKLSLPQYNPIIISNPYKMVFENDYWEKTPESWVFSPSINI